MKKVIIISVSVIVAGTAAYFIYLYYKNKNTAATQSTIPVDTTGMNALQRWRLAHPSGVGSAPEAINPTGSAIRVPLDGGE